MTNKTKGPSEVFLWAFSEKLVKVYFVVFAEECEPLLSVLELSENHELMALYSCLKYKIWPLIC